MSPRVPIDREALSEICRRFGVRRLSLFGSVLGDDFGADSDVDVLVEFQESGPPSLSVLLAMEDELSRLFGRTVDLVPRSEVERSGNYIRRKRILESAHLAYVA